MTPITQEDFKKMYPEVSQATKHVAAIPFSLKELTIHLPLPSHSLSPNARVHWRAKAQKTKLAREIARLAAITSLDGEDPPRWATATARLSFTFAVNRNRDKDNLLASCKAFFDGIADAGIVANDSGITHEPIVVNEPDKDGVGVVLRIRVSEP